MRVEIKASSLYFLRSTLVRWNIDDPLLGPNQINRVAGADYYHTQAAKVKRFGIGLGS